MTFSEWIGPLGNLLEVRGPAPGLAASRIQSSSVTRTLGGGTSVQLGPLGARTFEWSLPHATPVDVANLVALQQGVYGPGPFWWYDPLAVKRNMLHPWVASPGLSAGLGWSGSVSSPSRGSLTVSSGTAASGVMPVIPGRVYTGAAEVDASARVHLSWTDADGSSVDVEQGDLGTGRRTVTGAAPDGVAGVRLALDPDGAATFSRMQLTESDGPIDWFPGVGMPRVAIMPPAEVYQAAWGDTRTDYSVVLQEVL